MVSYTIQFSICGVLYRKEKITSVNININNLKVNGIDDIALKLDQCFCG